VGQKKLDVVCQTTS